MSDCISPCIIRAGPYCMICQILQVDGKAPVLRLMMWCLQIHSSHFIDQGKLCDLNIALRSLCEVNFSAYARHYETRYADSYNKRSIVNSPTNRRKPQQVIVARPESITTLFPKIGGTCMLTGRKNAGSARSDSPVQRTCPGDMYLRTPFRFGRRSRRSYVLTMHAG